MTVAMFKGILNIDIIVKFMITPKVRGIRPEKAKKKERKTINEMAKTKRTVKIRDCF